MFRGDQIMIDTRKYGKHMPWVRGNRYRTEDDLLNAGTGVSPSPSYSGHHIQLLLYNCIWTPHTVVAISIVFPYVRSWANADWVAIDPDEVDMRVFSSLENVDFLEFEQEAGDCVFIPYSMLHYVDKLDTELGAAVSFMWQNTEEYDATACASAPLEQTRGPGGGPPLAIFDVLWFYAGTGCAPPPRPAQPAPPRPSTTCLAIPGGGSGSSRWRVVSLIIVSHGGVEA